MWGEPKQATSATTALIYITLGALTDVWSVVYWMYLRNHGGTDVAYLYAAGFFFTGVVLFLIGLAVGRIGHAARSAEVAATPTTQVISPNVVAGEALPMDAVASPTTTVSQPIRPAPTVVSSVPVASSVASNPPNQMVPNT